MGLRDDKLLQTLRESAIPFDRRAPDFRPLIDLIGDADFVLIGEASHGTHEFYDIRAALTRRLIEEKGFHAVAVEADWPDAYRTNRFVRGRGHDADAKAALGDFVRFPRWMWRNTVMVDFVRWLRTHNDKREYADRVGFYGIDLYSMYASVDAVVKYLEDVDPAAAARARQRYACFETYEQDPQRYGYAAHFDLDQTCQDAAVQQLVDLRQHARDYLSRDGFVAEDELFFAQQNAVLVKNAESYYREMFSGRVNTWNLRDSHMADTLASLSTHLSRRVGRAKIVVWAHNSHLGDARATYMHTIGEHNVGQLLREQHPGKAVLIGFTTYSGTVTAADNWDAPGKLKQVQPGLPGSYEALFHEVNGDFLLNLRDPSVAVPLREPRLERAIGVIYRPQTERQSHYFDCRLSEQFDAVIHLDQTRALEPLDTTSGEPAGAEDETYPFGV